MFKRMKSGLWWLISIFGIPGDVQTITVLAIAAWSLVSAFIGGWYAYFDLDRNWPIAAFLGLGIFCFGAVALIQIVQFTHRHRLSEKLFFAGIIASQLPTANGKCTVKLIYQINNCADFTIFYRLGEDYAAIKGSDTVPDGTPPDLKSIPNLGNSRQIMVTIYDVDRDWDGGHMRLDIQFGRKRNSLTHRWKLALQFSRPILTVVDRELEQPLKFKITSEEFSKAR